MRNTTKSRRGLLRRIVLALGVSGFALFGILASAPEARAADIFDCLDAVDGLVDACLGDDPGWARNFACKWAGGVGYIICGVSEASKEVAKSLPFPI